MKTINLLLVISVLLVGCRSTKKIVESSAVISNQTETVQKVDVKEETKVNNDKSTYKKTTITETEYLTPQKTTGEQKAPSGSTEQQEPESVIKAVKVTIIEEGTKDNSIVETKKVDNTETATKTEDKSEIENKTVEKKTVPIPWWPIFGIGVLIFAAFVYFSKSGFGLIVKTFIKKLFA